MCISDWSSDVCSSDLGSGSGLSVLSTVVVAKVSSVADNWLASEDGVNSATVPRTCTRLPTCASAGAPALVVNTNTPSEVSGSASSSLAAACTKKPLNLRKVTMPSIATTSPTTGEVLPGPCTRSEERRVGKAGVSTCSSRWSPEPSKKNHEHNKKK